MAAYLDVLLRGLGLAGQAMAVGGVVFCLWVLCPSRDSAAFALLNRRAATLIISGAVMMLAARGLGLLAQLSALSGEDGWPIREMLGTTSFRAAIAGMTACLGFVAGGGRLVRGGLTTVGSSLLLVGSAGLLIGASAWMSHAAARMQGRAILLGVDAVHQLAASVWVGGLVHLTAAASCRLEQPWPLAVLRRFSTLALAAVGGLVAAGIGLAVGYVDGIHALLGTAYGVMVLTKAVILAGLVALGRLNRSAVSALSGGSAGSLARVRRFVEVELGLGITALFVAASLTSLPPAIDVVADRATPAEIQARFTPRWPALESPSIEAARVTNPDAPRSADDRAWSEYNHHYAGFVVLAMGLLAIAEGVPGLRWARHWPLLFLALAAFLFMRNDPEAWPLGPAGLWASMADPVVLQHRLFVVLIVALGVFEWLVRSGRVQSPRYALVFPLLCVVSGGLLLAHFHAGDNLKDQFLIEVTHAPLGLLGTFAGWMRWLELRLEPTGRRCFARLAAFALILVGALLVFYRES